MNLSRYLMVIVILHNPNFATATPIKSTGSSAKTNPIQCADAPTPDPVTQFESLPVHSKLAEQVMEYSPVTGYNQANRAVCQSKHFKYMAIRENDRVQVISYYRKNGRIHAKYLAVKNKKISGNYRKHGILSAFWPDGKKQAIEYFCDGFAVGFHQYFDKNGKLAYVIDYTHSDYEWQKRIGVGDFRKFYQGRSNWGNADLSKPTQLFREVYSVNDREITRKAFATTGIFSSSWIALDLTSTIDQWTKPGDQGMVMIGNESWNVVNNNFEYLPFSEVYQQKMQALPGLRSPQSFHLEMLACPWINEAMQLGVEDERFKLKPITAVSAQEIASSPQSRYVACLAKPSADCLFEQTYENLQFERSHKATYVNGFGEAALATGYPEWTRKAMTVALAETRGYRLPNPVFAEPASLKAQAEFALGLNQEAEATLNTALDNVFTLQQGYSIPYDAPAITARLFLLTKKPLNREKVRDFYALAKSKKIPKSLTIIEAFAIALVRHGKIEEAMQLTEEYFPKNNPFASLHVDSIKEFNNANKDMRHNYLQALIALVDGQIKRGDLSAAQAALSEIEKLEPSYDREPGLEVKAASVLAQLGNADKALNAIKDIYVNNHYQEIANIAISLCKLGKKTDAISFADKIRTATFNSYSWEERRTGKYSVEKLTTIPHVQAYLAKIDLFCGDAEQAKSNFNELLKSSDTPVKCRSDVCGNPYENAQRMRKAALDAGLVDWVWEQKVYDDPVFSFEVALQRAKQGDAASALSRLDSFAEQENVQRYSFMYSLIRAQILAMLGRDADADKAFSKARQFAIHMTYAESRAKALLEMAKAYLELKQNERALAATNETLSNLASNGLYPDIVRMLAELGADRQAQSIALALLEPPYLDHFSRRKEQELGRSRILGEVAVSRFQEEQETESLEDLKAVQPFGVRLSLWLKALKIADQRHNDDGLEFVGDALVEELNGLPASLGVGMGHQERREILHNVAKALRMKMPHLAPEKQLETLQQLIEQARLMTEAKEGAKALCELGYTAKKMNQPTIAKTLFDEGVVLAAKLRARTFPIDEPALGACAFWLKTAGDTNRADTLVVDLLNQMPKSLETVGFGSVSTLLNVAIAYAEYEKGEVQWLDGSRLEP